MKAHRFIRIPFPTWGHQVTAENMEVLSAWCKGTVVRNEDRSFILVPVVNARNPKQMEAGVGHWILKARRWGKTTFKVYPPADLAKDFFELPGDWGGDEELDYELPPVENLIGMIPSPATNAVVRQIPTPLNYRPSQRHAH